MTRRLTMTCLAITAGLAALPASAQVANAVAASPTVLTIVTEGRSARAPDLVLLSGGVVTQAPTAAAAMAANAAQMNKVMAAIRGAGIAARDIQTSDLSLQPQYRYDSGVPPALTGYQASNMVMLKVRRVGDTGRLLDTLVGAGVNQISGPVFQVEAAGAALDEARRDAVAQARARAALYAGAAGMRLGRILSISENPVMQGEPRPMMKMAMAQSAEATPVAPGEVAMSVTVTMTFALD